MAAASRKTVNQLRETLLTKFIYSIGIVVADLKKGLFNIRVTTSDAAGVSTNPVVTTLADAYGKVKSFKDVDAGLKEIMSIAPANTTVVVTSLDSDDFSPAAPLNPVKAAKSEVKKLTTAIARATVNETKASQLILQIGTFDGGSVSQQAVFDEAEAALAAISADKALMADRKADLDTYIAANGG